MDNIEVELKFPVKDYQQLVQNLDSIATIVEKDIYQKDTYFVPSHRNFIAQNPISEWLRVRKQKNGDSINYKRWHNKDECKAVSCDEFETIVENISSLEKILESMNFKKIIIVEKTRNIWEYKNVQISIDNVSELGHYIELEAKGKFKDITEAKEHLYSIPKELNVDVGKQDFKGYPHLMLEHKGLF